MKNNHNVLDESLNVGIWGLVLFNLRLKLMLRDCTVRPQVAVIVFRRPFILFSQKTTVITELFVRSYFRTIFMIR